MDDSTRLNANVWLTGNKMQKGIIYQSSSKMGEEGTEIAISSYILYFFGSIHTYVGPITILQYPLSPQTHDFWKIIFQK